MEAALRIRTGSFVIDGEAVLLGVDGISDFNGLHSRRHNDDVQLYAFDILALEGDDLRGLPLHLRKINLSRLLARRPEGIFISDFEQGEIGPDCFGRPANTGLKGWFLSAATAPIGLADRRAGSTRTAAIRRWKGSRSRSHD